MRRKRTVLVIVAFGLSILFSSFSFIPETASAYTLHDPIHISGTGDFTAINGVVGGSGSPSDPFIIEGWEINASAYYGIYISNTDAHFVIRDVYVHSGDMGDPPHTGVMLVGAKNSVVENSTFANNRLGLNLNHATNMTVRNNTFISDGIGIEPFDNLTYANSHTITPDNLVNGKPVWYHTDTPNLHVDGGTIGQLIIVNCPNATVENTQIDNTDAAIFVRFSENASIINNTISDSFGGVGVGWSPGSTLSSNRIHNTAIAVACGYSSNVTIEENELHSSEYHATFSEKCDDILIRNNSMRMNLVGVADEGGSDRMTISGNTIQDNEYGILVYSEPGLHVSHNDFINNSIQIFPMNWTGDSWDDGYPSGGNYWSDYAGIDNCSGPNQDICPDPDGIGDTPYSVENNSQDRYPFMEPLHVVQEPPGNSPPECEIEHPVEGARIHGTHAIEGSAHDEDGEVVRVEIRIDDEPWIHVEGTTHWSYDWETENVSNGEYTIYARSYDGEDYSDEVNVTVEVHNPTEEEMMYGEIFFWTAVVLVVIIALVGLGLELRRRKKEES